MKEFMRYEKELIELRRDFHMHPELGFNEKRTSKIVEDYLKSLGIKTKRMAKTGVVGYLDNGGDKTIALRADMDALPIQEENNVEYRSQYDGIMHACGHDAHTAMLLIASKILSQKKLKNNIRFIFQPAEEGLNGAREMIKGGAIEGVDYIIGLHVWSDLPAKTFAISSGPVLAAVDRFTADIIGKGGHGAAPHQTKDPIVATASIIMNLQSIISRNTNPLKSGVVTVGKVSGGTAFNIIPQKVRIEGTVRTFDEDVHEMIERRIKESINNTAKAFGCKSRIRYDHLNYATVNDEDLAKMGRKIASRIANVVEQEKSMGGEDFSEYARIIPGLFVFLGVRNEKRGIMYPHHSPKFDVDESALIYGTAFEVMMGEY